LDKHIDRLYHSAGFLQIQIPMEPENLIQSVVELVRRNGLDEGYIRIVVSRGTGPLGLRNIDRIKTSTVVIICQSEPIKTPEQLIKAPGKRAKTVSTRRTPPVCVDPRVKACHYLNNILADLERRVAGVDFALMLDTEGYVCEGPAENIFLVKNNCLKTPFATKCLDGITRRTIIALAPDLGWPVFETNMTLYDVYQADEMFSTGSLNDVTWIKEVDGHQIGNGKAGPITRKLLPALRDKQYHEGTPVSL
jgi:branched-chain amino acid aminotransferase